MARFPWFEIRGKVRDLVDTARAVEAGRAAEAEALAVNPERGVLAAEPVLVPIRESVEYHEALTFDEVFTDIRTKVLRPGHTDPQDSCLRCVELWTPAYHRYTPDEVDEDGGVVEVSYESYLFHRGDTCTPHCGTSSFAEWAHTPKCEADYEKAAALEEE